MRRVLLAAIVSFTSIFGIFGGDNAKIENNNINYASDGSIILTFKATSPDMMVLKHDIEYNSNEFEIEKVQQNKYFNYEYKDTTGDKNIVTKTILLDSEYSFDSIEYMQLYLKPKENIESGTITIKNIELANSDHKRLKASGTKLTIILDEEEAKVVKEELVMQNIIVKAIRENKKLSLTICIAIILLIIIKNIIQSNVKKNKSKKDYFTDMKTVQNPFEEQNESEGIELIKKVEKEESEKPINDDIFKNHYEVFILLFLIGAIFTVTTVYAKKDNVQDVRNGILNKTYDKSLDYNSDKKLNVIDLVYAIEPNEVQNRGNINFK